MCTNGAGVTVSNTDDNNDFTVTNGANVATDGQPEAYPSIYAGNHWTHRSSYDPFYNSSGDAYVTVADLNDEFYSVITTDVTTPTTSGGTWDDAYDIWFSNSTTGYQNQGTDEGLEVMIWLDSSGNPQPRGYNGNKPVDTGVYMSDGLGPFNVYWDPPTGSAASGNYSDGTLTFELASGSVSQADDLNLEDVAVEASVAHSYLPTSWYLIGVEAGFETWQDGSGSKLDNFNVTRNGVPEGFIVTQESKTEDLYADDPGGSTTAGTQLLGESSGHDLAGEQWFFDYNNSVGAFNVRLGGHSSECMTVSGGGDTTGTKVVLEPCSSNLDQQWLETGLGNGNQGLAAYGATSASGNLMVLDDPSGASGGDLTISASNGVGNPHQNWTLPESGTDSL